MARPRVLTASAYHPAIEYCPGCSHRHASSSLSSNPIAVEHCPGHRLRHAIRRHCRHHIYPQGIIQQISIGSPTLLKYVWHVILDGQYATETPEVNRAYIIGRDQYGNPVYGTAVNTDEVALVGERLDFQPDPAIPTTAQAADVARAVLSKMRLRERGGSYSYRPIVARSCLMWCKYQMPEPISQPSSFV